MSPDNHTESPSEEDLFAPRDENGNLEEITFETSEGTIHALPIVYGYVDQKFGDRASMYDADPDDIAEVFRDRIGDREENNFDFSEISGEDVHYMWPNLPSEILVGLIEGSRISAEVDINDEGNPEINPPSQDADEETAATTNSQRGSRGTTEGN